MPRLVHSFALLLATSLATPAVLAYRPAPEPVQLQVIDRASGQPLAQAMHRGQRWVAGEPGQRYAIRLTNTSHTRVLVVLSVDGINAISGETASPQQTGYVLAAGQSTDIAGWRKSMREVAGFHFTDLGDSYAARTGRPDDVGVIGIAVFHERPAQPMPRPQPPIASAPRSRDSARAMERTAGDAATAQSIGTGHGVREHAPVTSTSFQRASREPSRVITLRYDTSQRLLARGVPLPRRHHAIAPPHAPRAFPGNFVPDPPGW